MESIETLNTRLKDYFGADDLGRPIFRIVWANDELEKRYVTEIDGIQLVHPIVREVKKYSYMKDLYVLERLVVVPEFQQKELADVKVSYEPIWTYCDTARQPLPPIWSATELVINALYAALGKKSLRKYIDNEHDPEVKEDRIKKLSEELFGNETETGDAMAYGEAVVVPQNYVKES